MGAFGPDESIDCPSHDGTGCNVIIGSTETTGVVYVVARGGPEPAVKVGITTGDPRSRLGALQTGCPDRLELVYVFHVDDLRGVEREMHRVLAHRHRLGEWFNCTPEQALQAWERVTGSTGRVHRVAAWWWRSVARVRVLAGWAVSSGGWLLVGVVVGVVVANL